MIKTFSTKLDTGVLQLLDKFCRQYHIKKSSFLEDLIREGVRKRMETLEFAESIQRGLEQEKEGDFYTVDEVESLVFKVKK